MISRNQQCDWSMDLYFKYKSSQNTPNNKISISWGFICFSVLIFSEKGFQNPEQADLHVEEMLLPQPPKF